MIISLVGFMGTGKTSVAKAISQKINYKFADTDLLIEDKYKLKVTEIFKNYGENYFRQIEKEILEEFFNEQPKDTNIILATGGGIVLSSQNIINLKKYSTPILLTASKKTILYRLKKENRLLLKGEKDKEQRIEEILNNRKKYYNQFNNVINTNDKNINKVADKIINKYIK
ncbi:MAG: shikimate kinase [Bacillota bacterium]